VYDQIRENLCFFSILNLRRRRSNKNEGNLEKKPGEKVRERAHSMEKKSICGAAGPKKMRGNVK